MAELKTKEDIAFHSEAGSRSYNMTPAVNVKVYDSLDEGFKKWAKNSPDYNKHFTLEWIESHVDENRLESYWEWSCEHGWEELQFIAEDIYGPVKVYSAGRQGGWAWIDGINDDVESWDAIEFSKWKKFGNSARRIADWVMAEVVEYCYLNDFEEWKNA